MADTEAQTEATEAKVSTLNPKTWLHEVLATVK